MILESSYATNCNKSLYILVTQLSQNCTQENYSNCKRTSWNVDFSKFFFSKFYFVQLTIYPFKILTENTDFFKGVSMEIKYKTRLFS